jgi:hypothetical protein
MTDPTPPAETASAPQSPKKAKTVKKPTVKKEPTRKAPARAAKTKSLVIKKAKSPVKSAVKAKVQARKKAKTVKPKSGKKSTKSTRSGLSKFESIALEAISLSSTDESPFVSGSKVKQYAVDYLEKTPVAQIPRLIKRALEILVAKRLLKAKKDSYAFTLKGKAAAPKKVENRKKVVRTVKEKKAATKPKKAETPAKKALVTRSGRTSRPVQAA